MQIDHAPYPAGPDVHVWLASYGGIVDPALLARLDQLLDPHERAQQHRFYFADDRLRYLVTRAMVRTVLSRYAPVAPADWAFTVNGYGRPEIAARHAASGLCFNISHTRGMIVVAVARQRAVGIDIENVALREAPLDLAGHYLAPVEAAELAALQREQRHARFFEYWTLKECYIKARGMGLSLPLQSFHFSFPAPARVALTVGPDTCDDAARWQFWQCRPAPDYLLAVCAEKHGAVAASIIVHAFFPDAGDQPVDMTWVKRSG